MGVAAAMILAAILLVERADWPFCRSRTSKGGPSEMEKQGHGSLWNIQPRPLTSRLKPVSCC